MRIGICCGNPAQWEIIARLGYDFIEGSFSQIATASEEELARLIAAKEACGLPIEACNCFFPGGFALYAYDPLTGEPSEGFAEVEARVRAYVGCGMARAAQLGTKVVVIGSSAARSIPEKMKRKTAENQFARVLTVCADIGMQYGITVTVEPLCPKETNFINTLSDSLDMIDAVAHPNLKAMNDFYHSRIQSEPISSLDRAGDRLVHVHIARSDRDLPRKGDGERDLRPCVEELLRVGYNGRLSLEGNAIPDFVTAATAARGEMARFRTP